MSSVAPLVMPEAPNTMRTIQKRDRSLTVKIALSNPAMVAPTISNHGGSFLFLHQNHRAVARHVRDASQPLKEKNHHNNRRRRKGKSSAFLLALPSSGPPGSFASGSLMIEMVAYGSRLEYGIFFGGATYPVRG